MESVLGFSLDQRRVQQAPSPAEPSRWPPFISLSMYSFIPAADQLPSSGVKMELSLLSLPCCGSLLLILF